MIETLKLCRDRKMLLLIPVILYNGACQSRRRELLACTARLAYLVRLAYALTTRGRRYDAIAHAADAAEQPHFGHPCRKIGRATFAVSYDPTATSGCLVLAHPRLHG
jgi:hypothetical protein